MTDVLFRVWLAVAKRTSCDDADRIAAPIKWYVETGRCSTEFLRAFNAMSQRQITTVAKRLIKVNGMDYDTAIGSVKEYLAVS